MINKREIRALSIAGALNFENTVHRREALWHSELAIQPKGELFESLNSFPPYEGGVDAVSADGVVLSTPSFLKRMEGLQLVEADLKKTGISIGKHPMSFVREQLRKHQILSAAESRDLRKNQIASVAGAVIIRQRPMTAKDVVFITLEDETGHSNFVVMPDKFEEYRSVINQSDYLIIRGIFEERGMLKTLSFKTLEGFTAEVVSHNFR
jgi:error-prone DNA polymerase